MKHLRVHEVAEQLMVGPDAVRKYVSMGLLECSRTPSGQRVFTQEQVDAFRGISPAPVIAFYVRSSNGDKARMDSQVVALTKEYGAPVQVFSDKSSGLNENRRGLTRMIESAKKGEFTVLCVTQNDRLSRFGFTYLKDHLATLGVSVNVLYEKADKSLEDELMSDFMSLIALFSGKFYRLRGKQQQQQLLDRAKETL